MPSIRACAGRLVDHVTRDSERATKWSRELLCAKSSSLAGAASKFGGQNELVSRVGENK